MMPDALNPFIESYLWDVCFGSNGCRKIVNGTLSVRENIKTIKISEVAKDGKSA